ncbi:MAG: hypothetical protein AAFY31_18270, partial [Pseudomonadota bacterium]
MKTIRPPLSKDLSIAAHGQAVSSPLGTFFLAALVGGILLVLGSLMIVDGTTPAVVTGLAAYLVATIMVARGLATDFPHPSLGLCNIATLGRLVIVGILFTALLQGAAPSWATLALAVMALC